MTRAHKLRAGIIVAIVLGAITVSVLLLTGRSPARPLSLLFERYGTVTTIDPSTMNICVQEVAFFWITNSSENIYYLAQAGGTNTSLRDAPIGLQPSWLEGSYMPMFEFTDQPPTGSTRPLPPVSFASLGRCVSMGPHSGQRLRIPLPPEGQKRKFAVICTEPYPGIRPFWTSSMGGTVSRLLPRAVAKKAMWRQPALLRVWCDRELSHDRARIEKR